MIHIASVFHHTLKNLRKLVPDFNLSINLKGFAFENEYCKAIAKSVSFVNLKFINFKRM